MCSPPFLSEADLLSAARASGRGQVTNAVGPYRQQLLFNARRQHTNAGEHNQNNTVGRVYLYYNQPELE